MSGKKSLKPQVDGRIWLSVDGKPLLGRGRVELLKGIRETGSISRAAKAMKMSYKAAWDAVDATNRAWGKPLVQTSPGGSTLTDEAKRLIAAFHLAEARHHDFLSELEKSLLH